MAVRIVILSATIACMLHDTLAKVPQFVPHMVSSDGVPGEFWSYTEVRPGANMFSWLYYTTHTDGYTNRPWIIWLQGGPGLSSTGYGNFAQFGPVDSNLDDRNISWVQSVSVLYIDNPVTAGFSYVEDGVLPPANNTEAAADVISLLQVFLEEKPEFKELPLYIFGQSYGGKWVVGLGHYLQKAIFRGDIKCNLAGIAIGNGYVSPGDILVNLPKIFTSMGFLDDNAVEQAQDSANKFLELSLRRGDPEALEELNSDVYGKLYGNEQLGASPDVYNMMQYWSLGSKEVESIYGLNLAPLMDGHVREKLSIIPPNVNWTGWSSDVYEQIITHDYYWPDFDLVDYLLKESDVKVNVYEGQLDIICNAKGAREWIQRLTWPGLMQYNNSSSVALLNPETNEVEMLVQSYDTLAFYLVLGVGHTVPNEAPETALRMLERMVGSA